MNSPDIPVVEQRLARRDIATRFKPGRSPNPAGRGLGNYGGRRKALGLLDAMLAKEENQARLRMAMEEEFRKNPMRFFKTYIMPLLPQNMMIATTDETGKSVQWTSILQTVPDNNPPA